MKKIRSVVPRLEDDRYMAQDIDNIKQMVMDRSIIASLGELGLLPPLVP